MKDSSYTISMKLILLILFTWSCSAPKQNEKAGKDEVDVEFSLNFERIGALMLDRMDLQQEEKVLLVASPGRFDGLIPIYSPVACIC